MRAATGIASTAPYSIAPAKDYLAGVIIRFRYSTGP